MQITRLMVRIGDHEECVMNCSDENPDVAELMKMAHSSSAIITIEVPASSEAAAALGRLIFAKPKGERSSVHGDSLTNLSKRLESLRLSDRVMRSLKAADFTYVWQVAEKSEAEMRKVKNLGNQAINQIKQVILEELGLGWGTDISSIKAQLPGVPHRT